MGKASDDKDKVHAGQWFYDQIFLLFVLCNLITLLCFDIWGVLDIMNVK